jgi:hypothetical protein
MLTLAEIYESMGKKSLALEVLEKAGVGISARPGKQHQQAHELQEISARVLKLEELPNLVNHPDPGPALSLKEKAFISERIEPTPQSRSKRRFFCCF